MKMYIARDSDGSLALFKKKPKMRIEEGYGKFWVGTCLRICTDEYPEVTFENSPMEVELVPKEKDFISLVKRMREAQKKEWEIKSKQACGKELDEHTDIVTHLEREVDEHLKKIGK